MHGYEGWHMGGMWWWWIPILVVLGALVWFVASRAGGRRDPENESAEQALKRRYANGEIDRETYQSMLSDLRK